VDHADFERLAGGEVWQEAGQAGGKHGFAAAGHDSVTMPGVRRLKFGSTIRFILDVARWCRSRCGGGLRARNIWLWFSPMARLLCSRPGWRKPCRALPLLPHALAYRLAGSSNYVCDSMLF
jgi:hypothetical protein